MTLVAQAFRDRMILIVPIVLSELLSSQYMLKELQQLLVKIPLVELHDGVWQRCGIMRRNLLSQRKKARLADSLIAQICIDADVPLITRDRDFMKYREYGLKLV